MRQLQNQQVHENHFQANPALHARAAGFRSRQKGVAIITVMLIIALVTVIAVHMSGRLQLQIGRVTASEYSEQAYWHWLSAEALARRVLKEEREQDGRFFLEQNWAQQQGPFPVDGGTIGGRIRDLHSCFNLNALWADPNNSAYHALAVEQYAALLEVLEFDRFTIDRLSATLIDWLDADTELVNNYGAEDADYMALPQPYQAANTLMTEFSDLRQVRGYTAEVMERLRPYVCVIPGQSRWEMNINTVDAEQAEIVSAFFRGNMDVSSAENMLRNRPSDGWGNKEEIVGQAEIEALENSEETEYLTIDSEFFELRARVQYGDLEFFGHTVMHFPVSSGNNADQAAGNGTGSNNEIFILHRARGGYQANE